MTGLATAESLDPSDVLGVKPIWERSNLNPLTRLALAIFGGEVMVRKNLALQPNIALLQTEAFPKRADHYVRTGGLGKNRPEAIEKDFIKNLQLTDSPRVVPFEDIRQMAHELAELGGNTRASNRGAQRLTEELQSGIRPIDAYLLLLCDAAITHTGHAHNG